jgi:hypothetical protein
MIDSHPRRTTEIICDGENFIRRFTLVEQPLGIRAGRADRKQFRGDPDKSGKEQLLPVQFRTKPRHGVKQTARKPLARACGIIDMAL